MSAVFQFSSVTQLCQTPCDPMDGSMPGCPVHHQLMEFAQTQVHGVGDEVEGYCQYLHDYNNESIFSL